MEKETIQLDFEKMGGLVPAVVQDDVTQKVLMVGFMNEAAFHKTLDTNRVTFFSRTKGRLWTKGEQSGNVIPGRILVLEKKMKMHFHSSGICKIS